MTGYDTSDIINGMNHECQYCYDPIPRFDQRFAHWLWHCPRFPTEKRRALMRATIDNGGAIHTH